MKNNDKVEELYTEKASLYDRFFIGFLGWGKELESFFLKTNYLRQNMKVLDAGCGTGIITKTLYLLAKEKSYGYIEFHAFDLTANMLEIFKQWVKKQDASSIELAQADVLKIEALPQHWKEHDLIVTIDNAGVPA